MSITIPGSEYTGPKSIAEEISIREARQGWIEYTAHWPKQNDKDRGVWVKFRIPFNQDVHNEIQRTIELVLDNC